MVFRMYLTMGRMNIMDITNINITNLMDLMDIMDIMEMVLNGMDIMHHNIKTTNNMDTMCMELNMAQNMHLNITKHLNITTPHMARVSMKTIILRLYLQRQTARRRRILGQTLPTKRQQHGKRHFRRMGKVTIGKVLREKTFHST